MSLIQTHQLTLSYNGEPIVKNLDLTVNEGDYLCIIGENGTGKTTLIKALLGLIPVSSGTLSYGEDLKRNQIGYLPQKTAVQRDFPASVLEIVLTGCLNQRGIRPFYNKNDYAKARQALASVEASHLEKRSFCDLSGGQQQRVLIARALCASDKMLLLDEPTSALDPDATEELYQQIQSLHRDSNLCIIMITHDMAAVSKYATKVLKLEQNGYEMIEGEEK